jgi:hypothetical protein|tara:strand:- start:21132 stop:21260 length:129 start_codon:yes stop_codon:yes gene_type:complete
MKTLTAEITFTHSDPKERENLKYELKEICDQYDCEIEINEEY